MRQFASAIVTLVFALATALARSIPSQARELPNLGSADLYRTASSQSYELPTAAQFGQVRRRLLFCLPASPGCRSCGDIYVNPSLADDQPDETVSSPPSESWLDQTRQCFGSF